MDNKAKNYICINYKDAIKGYKPWNVAAKNIVYSKMLSLESFKMFPMRKSYTKKENQRK